MQSQRVTFETEDFNIRNLCFYTSVSFTQLILRRKQNKMKGIVSMLNLFEK